MEVDQVLSLNRPEAWLINSHGAGMTRHDVCRTLLATLQLANDGGVELSLRGTPIYIYMYIYICIYIYDDIYIYIYIYIYI
jgi:hypothetical protein